MTKPEQDELFNKRGLVAYRREFLERLSRAEWPGDMVDGQDIHNLAKLALLLQDKLDSEARSSFAP